MADSPFLIVGGGIAGLAAGLGLARIGKSSHIFEKALDFQEVGAGLQLGPNAVRALQWLGAWDAVAPHCVAPAEIHVRDGISGAMLQRIPLGANFERKFGAPYRVAHRADLQQALLKCVKRQPDVKLRSSAEVANISIDRTALSLRSGETMEGEAIIAADGIHSRIRNLVAGPVNFGPGNHTLFRTLVPISAVPPAIMADVVTLWLCPGGHVVHYAVSNSTAFNIVASLEHSTATPETGFPMACKPLADVLHSQMTWSAWPARDIEPVPTWNQNRVVLIGDAAHASLPYLAQGAALALEDACVLSSMLQNVSDPATAFREFSGKRRARSAAIQKRSRQLGSIYHAGGALRLFRNAALKATPASQFLNRLSWIYSWSADGQ